MDALPDIGQETSPNGSFLISFAASPDPEEMSGLARRTA
jgi:hypothetical protein